MQHPDSPSPTTDRTIRAVAIPPISCEQVLREQQPPAAPVIEIGGRDGPEPTRFGDWERNGRCIDF
jgi:hypothetical protein